MAYNQTYGYGGPGAYDQGRPAGSYPAAPPAPYANPAYPANPQWPRPPPPSTLSTNPQNPYQFQVPPPAPPPSQPQAPSYMSYNPGAYGAIPESPSGPVSPPALPPRTQYQGAPALSSWSQNSAASLAHKPSVSGRNRYNVTSNAYASQQSHAPLIWNETAGHYEYASSGSQQQARPSAETPPTLPPRPGGSNVPPRQPTSPQQQAYLQNQAYLQHPSPGPQVPARPPLPGQSPGALQSGYGAALSSRPSSASPPPLPKPPGPQQPYSQPYSQPSSQGAGSPSPGGQQAQPAWFSPSGSRFPPYQPHAQFGTAPASHVQSPPLPAKLPAKLPEPSASPNAAASVPASSPKDNGPVSPMEHRDSVGSLYAPPPRTDASQGQYSHTGRLPVSRESSQSSIPPFNATNRPQVASPQELPATSLRTDSGSRSSAIGANAGPSSKWEYFGHGSVSSVDDTEMYARKNAIRRHEQEIEVMELDSTEIPLPKPLSQPVVEKSSDAMAASNEARTVERTESPASIEQKEESGHDTHTRAQQPKRSASMDIAPSLDPWYKNSLMRYIAMLYKEAGASQVEEKHRIFTDFMLEEAKIRGLTIPTTSGSVSGYTPVLEFLQDDGYGRPNASDSLRTGQDSEAVKTENVKVETNVVVSVPEEQEPEHEQKFSPGGRPIMAQPKQTTQASKETSRTPSPRQKTEQEAAKTTAQSEKTPEPKSTEASPQTSSTACKSAKPTYTPFRASANASSSGNQTPSSANLNQTGPVKGAQPVYKSIYRSYAPASANSAPDASATGTRKPSGLASSAEPPSASQKAAKPIATAEDNPTAVDKSTKPSEVNKPQSEDSPFPLSREPPSLSKLESLLLGSDPSTTLNPRLENLKTSLLLYPSDFTFVAVPFDAWKRKAASNRAAAEAGYRQRANENQKRIDQLFNENQIAYSDIALLEDSFKQQEAEIKSQENEQEYESYLIDVFGPLYKRLQEEITVVAGLLSDAETMAREDGVAGMEMLALSAAGDGEDDNGRSSDSVDLAESLSLVVELHRKLEERHDQLSDCTVKRDRRRRAIDEVTVTGADKLTQVEFRKRLDLVEKNAAAARYEEKKMRVQPLWQLVQSCSVRGMQENKAATEEITKLTTAAGEQLARPERQPLKDRILRSLGALAGSSSSLAESFYAIDTDLNLVEFNSALARATFDGAPRYVVAKLADEKGEEDVRLKSEYEARLNEIRTALKAAEEGVEREFRGKEGQAEHEKKMRAALEEAKRRNGEVRRALDIQTPLEPTPGKRL